MLRMLLIVAKKAIPCTALKLTGLLMLKIMFISMIAFRQRLLQKLISEESLYSNHSVRKSVDGNNKPVTVGVGSDCSKLRKSSIR